MIPGGTPRWRSLLWGAFLLLGFGVAATWAAETTPSPPVAEGAYLTRLIEYLSAHYTRETWDLTMRWINFLILVFVIVKYARAPVINFLKGKREETARAIERIEDQKRLAEGKVKERQIQLQASQDRLKMIGDRIVSEGKRQKEKMIAAAKQESRMMLASAHTRISNQIREARQTIRTELIESAAEKAMEKLPGMVTHQDHDRMIGLWMEESKQA